MLKYCKLDELKKKKKQAKRKKSGKRKLGGSIKRRRGVKYWYDFKRGASCELSGAVSQVCLDLSSETAQFRDRSSLTASR